MNADSVETLSVVDLLGQALTSVIFGNGWLVVMIVAVLIMTTILSRVFRGGAL